MAHLDVHPMPGEGAGHTIDVQIELLARLSTRVVVPLLPEEQVPLPISAVARSELTRSVASLEAQHGSITRALDLLLK